MKRRHLLIGATTVIAGLAGCASDDGTAQTEAATRTPEQNTPSPPYNLTLINDVGKEIEVSVEVRTKTSDEVLWSDNYDLSDGEQRDVDVQINPGEYVLRCWMPDGPVETLFGHEWSTTDEPSLSIRFSSSGVEFE